MCELTQPADSLASASRLSSRSSVGDVSTMSKIQKKYVDEYISFFPQLPSKSGDMSRTRVDSVRATSSLLDHRHGDLVSSSAGDRFLSNSTNSAAWMDDLTTLEKKFSQHGQNDICNGMMDHLSTTTNATDPDDGIVNAGFETKFVVCEDIKVKTMSSSLISELCPACGEGSNLSATTVQDAILSPASLCKPNDGHMIEAAKEPKQQQQQQLQRATVAQTSLSPAINQKTQPPLSAFNMDAIVHQLTSRSSNEAGSLKMTGVSEVDHSTMLPPDWVAKVYRQNIAFPTGEPGLPLDELQAKSGVDQSRPFCRSTENRDRKQSQGTSHTSSLSMWTEDGALLATIIHNF